MRKILSSTEFGDDVLHSPQIRSQCPLILGLWQSVFEIYLLGGLWEFTY